MRYRLFTDLDFGFYTFNSPTCWLTCEFISLTLRFSSTVLSFIVFIFIEDFFTSDIINAHQSRRVGVNKLAVNVLFNLKLIKEYRRKIGVCYRWTILHICRIISRHRPWSCFHRPGDSPMACECRDPSIHKLVPFPRSRAFVIAWKVMQI